MKKILNFSILAVVLGMLLTIGANDAFAQKRKPVIKKPVAKKPVVVAPKLFQVDTGTVFRVRMSGELTSATAKVGDRFTTTVTEPVYSSAGNVVIPTGSTVTGKVDSVVPAKKGGDPGSIAVSFISVRTPDGKSHAINGSLTDLSTKTAKSDNESTASGDDRKNDKIIFIGGGAGGGALLGAAIGGGKGALIGGIIGAGAGLLGERLTKGEEAQVKSGTEFGVYLNQAISLPKWT
ncbi:MAG TPA: hypothetical protein PKY59_25585, partial [Pyrinomonadaceae bacterium]|nr:hypothetical protein [Pyrinomonadaceae bacterium]